MGASSTGVSIVNRPICKGGRIRVADGAAGAGPAGAASTGAGPGWPAVAGLGGIGALTVPLSRIAESSAPTGGLAHARQGRTSRRPLRDAAVR
ncbi:hypothetical protein GCM10025865_25320 [Paraoerskovia sediminicola]|uniref:Uncharacterized protein n=1 Tax=Paraoerskovia sediminicola TaxID=1138587 RepID=A0ABM8G506_9CELL|nr:hypothetical protein GCM10025865_25320 [Paraoerskovia sediminicola]